MAGVTLTGTLGDACATSVAASSCTNCSAALSKTSIWLAAAAVCTFVTPAFAHVAKPARLSIESISATR
ncbi:hypothetical protein D3C87_2194380 [compost metagenome]